MLGDISPQTVRITQQAVVYPSRDHVTSLRVERFDGRSYRPVDMTAVTRVILSFPEADPVIVYDSSVQAVFTHLGSTLTVDLSDYAMPASVLGCQIILYDAEHPAGQVLVDDIDAVVQFDFRNVHMTGGTPPPAVDYLTDAPIDGVTYARKDGLWVPVDARVSGVSSVNGQSGVVVLDAADVGADAAGTGASQAASAVAAHTALADPHPQYLTPVEGNAAYERVLTAGTNVTIDRTNPSAPVINASGGGGGGAVDSVNGQTGVVVLDTDDIAEGVSNLYFTNGRAAAAAPVQAVDGQTGAVSLSSSYAPLSHVGAGGTAHSNAVAAGSAGFMTGADKTKLDGIAAGAQVNVGTNISVGYNPAYVFVNSSTGADATLNAATGIAAGVMSAADKTKIDGVATGATANSADAVLLARANHTGTQTASTISDFASASRAQAEAELVAGTNVTITPSGSGATRQLTIAAAGGGGSTNLSTTTSTTTLTVNSDTGTDAVLPAATPSVAGVLTAADKTKLDGIAAGATANSSDATLLDRANHTGSQAISTVTGLQTELDGKEAVLTAGTNITIDRTNPAAPVISATGGGFTGGTLTTALNEAPAVTLASASTVNIGAAAANTISITGTTTINAFDTIANGAVRLLEFAAALTLTHNGTSLILPTGANIVTAAGDVAEFRSLGSGNWRCVGYLRADGTPLAGGGGGGLTNFVEAKTTAAPNATVPAVSLSVTITEASGDAVFRAKGEGATMAQVPDNTVTGGNKRGNRATDWQKQRNDAGQVAAGNLSTIGGGGNNYAFGANTTIGGGVSNYTSGTYATIAGGLGGVISAQYGFIGCGNSNTINSGADYGAILGGLSNLIFTNSIAAAILGGSGNTASGPYTIVLGGHQATTRGIYGAEVRASGQFSAQGDAQRGRYIKRRSTTTATPATIGTDGSAGTATNQVILPNNSAYAFTGKVVARENATGDCSAWEFKGLIRRGANAAATALVAAVTPTSIAADAGAAAWVVAVTADTTNGGIAVTVTGEAAHTIRWVADIETVEVVG